ncbi:MAG TPA: hypothetical protein VMD79_10545 [Solirubrobacteraceae bacterium]|nr:hypothetical protein [Solirubrobacteraceae bacterium]
MLKAALVIGGLALITVLVFFQQLFEHWTFPWDFVGAYTTTPAFVAASAAGGHLLSWSPFVASGFPVDVDPQAGVYFPGWWLLGGLDIPATLRVLTAVQVVHVLFGSVGMLALARVRRLAWSWAALAALAYLFFGGFYGEAEHADIVRGFAYTPWLLWALTPPDSGGRWTRLIAIPPLVWIIATGAYPGQLPAFAIIGLVYAAVALRMQGRLAFRRHVWVLVLTVTGAVTICAAVLLPYLRAEHAHELYRVVEPTASVRAVWSLAPRDLLGLFLDNFAWTSDGTVTSWAVGIPILVGLACVRWETLRRHAPLVVGGALALVLAMTPKIGIVGQAMASLRLLFPSRFPAAEYKAFVAVALILLGAEGWRQVVVDRRGLPWRAGLITALMVEGALLAPSTDASPRHDLWLIVLVALACLGLVLVRLPTRALIVALACLVLVDGVRDINSYSYQGGSSPWRLPPAAAAQYRARDGDIRKLPALLAQAPARRPARVPPYLPLASAPTGSDPDATGWIAAGYHLVDYGGTIERSLWRVEHNPAWLRLMLQPWNAYVFPCAAVGCSKGAVHLPAATSWTPSSYVRTESYGTQSIRYSVDLAQPSLMVENELSVTGWQANTSKVRAVDAGIPLRTWRLAAGKYTFTASFHEPGRAAQDLFAALALLAWLALIVVLARAPGARGRTYPA